MGPAAANRAALSSPPSPSVLWEKEQWCPDSMNGCGWGLVVNALSDLTGSCEEPTERKHFVTCFENDTNAEWSFMIKIKTC